MARITIVTNGHVSTSPRVWREANALSAHGFDVTVVGAWTSEETAAVDRSMATGGGWRLICAADLRAHGETPVVRFAGRLRRRVARKVLRFGYGSIEALVYAPRRLLASALSTRPDLYILHLEAGLWMGRALARRGYRTAVDVEDWYSENQDASQVAITAYLRGLEQRMLPRVLYCTVPSRAMGDALVRRYGIPEPTVIYNGDPQQLLSDCGPSPAGAMRLLWFSQTLGSDRGLDDATRALSRIGSSSDWSLDIVCRSSASARADLLRGLPATFHSRVRFVDPVPPSELPALCARYDVGLALEQKVVRSRDVTVTNKILRYAQSGAFVAATATAGHCEVIAAHPALGRTYEPRSPDHLAAILAEAASRLTDLRTQRRQRAAEANATYSFEAQAPKLIGLVQSALSAG